MKSGLGNFDRLASAYVWLERIAFGASLESARFGLIAHLHACRRVLVLGEGDGRFLKRLLGRFPDLQVDCLDASSAMIERARRRLTAAEAAQVTFRHEDALQAQYGHDRYDAVVTMFFLDCFPTEQVAGLIDRVAAALRPEACWLWADFAVPARGWRRWRAWIWLVVMYAFFRWQTGLKTRQLPPVDALLKAAGFEVGTANTLEAGLLRGAVYRRRSA